MKNLTSLALSLLATNLLVGCVTGDNLPPPDDQNGAQVQPTPTPTPTPTPIAFPQSCRELATSDPAAKDGEHTLYLSNDEQHPWAAYCVDMGRTAKDYLTLPNSNGGTWSMYRAGGAAPGTDVETRFDKVRIDPITLKLDISDQTFAVSTGSLTDVSGAQVTSMPLGVAMSCGGGSANANVDVGGTPFVLANTFSLAGDLGNTGYAGLWPSGQVIEMWADGNCGWIAPDRAASPPMNASGGFLISLSYQ
jgi:hypothetical protein